MLSRSIMSGILKLTSTHNGELIRATKAEFDKIWEKSDLLTDEKIASYARRRQNVIRVDQIREEKMAQYQSETISPNENAKGCLKRLASDS